MPELPDVVTYLAALRPRVVGRQIEGVELRNPFVLRTAMPPIEEANGREVRDVSRIGKRIVLEIEGERFLVIHLMIAGRLRWLARGGRAPGRITLALLHFASGTLAFTEAGTKRRASLHFIAGRDALRALDPGGVDVFAIDAVQFERRLKSENHTLKRALTDPRLFDGIGNAYSDEILHRARLSPLLLTSRIESEQAQRLFAATREVLREWIDRLHGQAGESFPEEVTAFRPEMAVHGKYGQPCPVCGAPVQRIVYAENECNYCARCQTGGVVLADRSLSRLLKASWPRSIDDV
jgi:formamidopyrimidine-DNA glycosylase